MLLLVWGCNRYTQGAARISPALFSVFAIFFSYFGSFDKIRAEFAVVLRRRLRM